jgi:hypothetical protein
LGTASKVDRSTRLRKRAHCKLVMCASATRIARHARRPRLRHRGGGLIGFVVLLTARPGRSAHLLSAMPVSMFLWHRPAKVPRPSPHEWVFRIRDAARQRFELNIDVINLTKQTRGELDGIGRSIARRSNATIVNNESTARSSRHAPLPARLRVQRSPTAGAPLPTRCQRSPRSNKRCSVIRDTPTLPSAC